MGLVPTLLSLFYALLFYYVFPRIARLFENFSKEFAYSTNVILAYPFPLCPVSVPPPGAVNDVFPACADALVTPPI